MRFYAIYAGLSLSGSPIIDVTDTKHRTDPKRILGVRDMLPSLVEQAEAFHPGCVIQLPLRQSYALRITVCNTKSIAEACKMARALAVEFFGALESLQI